MYLILASAKVVGTAKIVYKLITDVSTDFGSFITRVKGPSSRIQQFTT